MADQPGRQIAGNALVQDYMTSQAESLETSQSLLEAVLLLRKSGFRHIPILEQGRLAGVLSERDIYRFSPTMLLPLPVKEYNQLFEETRIGTVMTPNPQSIAPDAPLSHAVEIMVQSRLGCLPVMDAGQLVGIITVRDMLRALYDFVAPIPPPAESGE